MNRPLGHIGYINAKYVFGRDVPFDRAPVKILGIDYPEDYAATCSHIHLIDKTLQRGNADQDKTYQELTSKRHLKDNQERWTSNCFLVYYQHSMKFDSYAILDFWQKGHQNFSNASKQKLLNMIEAYEDSNAAKKII